MSADSTSPPVSKDAIARFVEQQDWISPNVEKAAQGVVTSAVDSLGGDPLRIGRVIEGDGGDGGSPPLTRA